LLAILHNPVRQKPRQVEAWLLAQTPIGTRRDDVEKMIESMGWAKKAHHPIGSRETSISVRLGQYQSIVLRGLAWNRVEADFHFDKNILIGVEVVKFMDVPR
jgi:hypothetical protein